MKGKESPRYDRSIEASRRRRSRGEDRSAIAHDIARIRMDEERRATRSKNLDSGEPQAVSPAAGRVQGWWRKRNPIIKGGAVTGKRSRYADA